MDNNKEIMNKMFCVSMRNGVELWVDEKVATDIQNLTTQTSQSVIISIGDKSINTADVVGIFSAQDMEEAKRRKNGQWKCVNGNWHDKNEKCFCQARDHMNEEERKRDIIKRCPKCKGEGWITYYKPCIDPVIMAKFPYYKGLPFARRCDCVPDTQQQQ